MLPFALIDTEPHGHDVVLLGQDEHGGLVGLSIPGADSVYALEPDDIDVVINTEPAAVFYGVRAAWASLVEDRAVANRAKKRLMRFAAKGQAFPVLPEGVLSGFPVAARTIRQHREHVPSLDTIRVSGLFALSTVRTPIEEAEKSYLCFGDLYKKRGRQMPSVQEIKKCFQGLQNTKSAMFQGFAEYAPTIRWAIESGYRDRELRSLLALDTELPPGLGLAKLSFTLALLGQDTICLDGRLLGTMFDAKARLAFEKATRKDDDGILTPRALLTYEAAEDAFLKGNRYYDANDPLGRARAQWMSWEAVGGKGATHSVWLDMLAEDYEPNAKRRPRHTTKMKVYSWQREGDDFCRLHIPAGKCRDFWLSRCQEDVFDCDIDEQGFVQYGGLESTEWALNTQAEAPEGCQIVAACYRGWPESMVTERS